LRDVSDIPFSEEKNIMARAKAPVLTNDLAITDAEVAADWSLGLKRSLAQKLAGGGKPDNMNFSTGEGYDMYNRIHGGRLFGSTAVEEVKIPCGIAWIDSVVDDNYTDYGYDSFGPGTETNKSFIYGHAICNCGKFDGRLTMGFELSDLIYSLAHEND
jgi:hypothetical protein